MYIVESFFPPPAFCCCCFSSSSPPFSSIAPTSATDETKMERREREEEEGTPMNCLWTRHQTEEEEDSTKKMRICLAFYYVLHRHLVDSDRGNLAPLPLFFVFGGNRQRSNRDDNWKEKRNWIQPSIPEWQKKKTRARTPFPTNAGSLTFKYKKYSKNSNWFVKGPTHFPNALLVKHPNIRTGFLERRCFRLPLSFSLVGRRGKTFSSLRVHPKRKNG